MRCVLIHNPVSGRNRHLHKATLSEISIALSNLGHSVEVIPTTAPGSAKLQTCNAVRAGADIVFACGGDGTINEVLQGLVSEGSQPSSTLGIIPLGSANALARHLHLSLDPVQAVLQQMSGVPHTIPVGKITYADQSRYFAVMAGAGPDGALAYHLLTTHKSRLGRIAYSLHAARLFATHTFLPFEVAFTLSASNIVQTRQAVSVMAARVSDLGGLFSRLTSRNASLDDPHLRLSILRGPAAFSLPLWFVLGWLQLNGINPFLEFIDVTSFACRPTAHSAAHFEADGECLGRIPMHVSIVPNALRILLPTNELHPTHGRNIGCG